MTEPSLSHPVCEPSVDSTTVDMSSPSPRGVDMSTVEDFLAGMVDSHDAVMLTSARNALSKDADSSPFALDHSTQAEPAFWPAYQSDEELASPIDSDDACDQSSSDARSFITLASCTETLAEGCDKAEEHVVEAHAVVLKPVGRAKVVAVHKPIDITARPRSLHRSSLRISKQARSIPDLNKLYTGAALSGLQRSALSSPLPTWSHETERSSQKLSSPSEAQTVQRKRSSSRLPSIPLIQAASEALPYTQAMMRSRLPTSPTSPDDQSLSSPRTLRKAKPGPLPPSPSAITRHMTKLSSTISFNRFGRARNSSDSSGSSGDDCSSDASSPVFRFDHQSTLRRPSAPVLFPSFPTSTPQYIRGDANSPSSLYRSDQLSSQPRRRLPADVPDLTITVPSPRRGPKMVARGAAEREPLLVLPPFPDEDEHVSSLSRGQRIPRQMPARWPARKSSSPQLRPAGSPHIANHAVVAAMGEVSC